MEQQRDDRRPRKQAKPGRRQPLHPGGRKPLPPGGRQPPHSGGRQPLPPGERQPPHPRERQLPHPGERQPPQPGGRQPPLQQHPNSGRRQPTLLQQRQASPSAASNAHAAQTEQGSGQRRPPHQQQRQASTTAPANACAAHTEQRQRNDQRRHPPQQQRQASPSALANAHATQTQQGDGRRGGQPPQQQPQQASPSAQASARAAQTEQGHDRRGHRPQQQQQRQAPREEGGSRRGQALQQQQLGRQAGRARRQPQGDGDPEPQEKKKRLFEKKSERRLDGRTFQRNFTNKAGKTYYRCSTKMCHGTAFRIRDGMLQLNNPHSRICHATFIDEEIAMREWIRGELKLRWVKLYELYKEAKARFKNAAKTLSYNSLNSSMKRWRLKIFPPSPTSLQQFLEQLENNLYEPVLRYTEDHLLTVHTVTDRNGDTHVLFYDRTFIEEFFQSVRRLFIDATFQCRPNLTDVCQLLTVLGVVSNHAALFLTAIMSTRKQEAYEAIFTCIRDELLPLARIDLILSDFEFGIRNSAALTWPNARCVGCNAHFDRAIYNRLKPLSNSINESQVMQSVVKQILALAYLPPDRIVDEFERQVEAVQNMGDGSTARKFQDFFRYFRRFWLNIVKPEGFSVFGLSSRTNNCSESTNSELAEGLGNRPVMCDFICRMMKMFTISMEDIAKLNNGKTISRLPRYSTIHKQEELLKLWRMLLDEEANYPTERFIEYAARLKGNVTDHMKAVADDYRIGSDFEIRESPLVVSFERDPDFDSTILLTENEVQHQRIMRRLARRAIAERDIPHVYRRVRLPTIQSDSEHEEDEELPNPIRNEELSGNDNEELRNGELPADEDVEETPKSPSMPESWSDSEEESVENRSNNGRITPEDYESDSHQNMVSPADDIESMGMSTHSMDLPESPFVEPLGSSQNIEEDFIPEATDSRRSPVIELDTPELTEADTPTFTGTHDEVITDDSNKETQQNVSGDVLSESSHNAVTIQPTGQPTHKKRKRSQKKKKKLAEGRSDYKRLNKKRRLKFRNKDQAIQENVPPA